MIRGTLDWISEVSSMPGSMDMGSTPMMVVSGTSPTSPEIACGVVRGAGIVCDTTARVIDGPLALLGVMSR